MCLILIIRDVTLSYICIENLKLIVPICLVIQTSLFDEIRLIKDASRDEFEILTFQSFILFLFLLLVLSSSLQEVKV